MDKKWSQMLLPTQQCTNTPNRFAFLQLQLLIPAAKLLSCAAAATASIK
jgi:hypothetical protein